MSDDRTSQHRKYLLTINNPLDVGLDHQAIKDILATLNPDYWAMCDEIASTGTPHTHVYIVRQSKIRFRTIKSKFPTAHIDAAYGSSSECKDYLLKQGKYAGTAKAETSVAGTFEEFGTLPEDDKETSINDKKQHLLTLIEQGKSNAEIIKEMPEYVFHEKDLEGIRQSLLQQKYQHEFRQMEVSYIYGPDSKALTELIYEQVGIDQLYRVPLAGKMNHCIQWDSYQSQDVILFEEFQSEIGYEEMVRYLQKYPLMLSARFRDRVACFTKVIITAEYPVEKQYEYKGRQKSFSDYIDNIINIDDAGCVKVQKGHWPFNRKSKVNNENE